MTLDIPISIISSIGFGLTAVYVAIARRHKAAWKAGIILLLACAELTFARTLQGISTDYAAKLFWFKMCHVGFAIAPTAFLCVALRFSGKRRALTFPALLLLSVFPALILGLIFTNELHGWVWDPASTARVVTSMSFLTLANARFGYWLLVGYSYIMMGLGCFFLTRSLLHPRGIYGRQTGAVILAAIPASLGPALDICNISPFPPFMATALGLAIGSITVVILMSALRRGDLLSVTHRAIYNSITDSIIVIDDDNRIADMNPAAERWMGKLSSQISGKTLNQVMPELEAIWASRTGESDEGKIFFGDSLRTVDIRFSTIQDWQGHIAGHVIVLRDITERKEVEEKLQRANEELQTLQSNLREQATRDYLTGLHNRRYMDEMLLRELARAAREEYPVSFVMIDIDFFKNVNDTFGHNAGDVVLQVLANLLITQARVSDIVCRYGGDEFLIVLPNMSTEVTFQIAERWRISTQATKVQFADKKIQVNISVGIATFPQHGATIREILAAVDGAMYQSKSEGRNRVMVYNVPRAEPGS